MVTPLIHILCVFQALLGDVLSACYDWTMIGDGRSTASNMNRTAVVGTCRVLAPVAPPELRAGCGKPPGDADSSSVSSRCYFVKCICSCMLMIQVTQERGLQNRPISTSTTDPALTLPLRAAFYSRLHRDTRQSVLISNIDKRFHAEKKGGGGGGGEGRERERESKRLFFLSPFLSFLGLWFRLYTSWRSLVLAAGV